MGVTHFKLKEEGGATLSFLYLEHRQLEVIKYFELKNEL